jgi:hypothetical protein
MVPNSGSYEWTPDSELPSGDDYAIMITSENGDLNYTPLITISNKSKASSDPSESATKSEPATETASMTMTGAPYSTGISGNSTISTSTRYSNSTKTGSKTTALPTGTNEPTAPADSGAISVIRSPLALVACLVGAIVYLN